MGEMLPGHIEALQAELARVRAERDEVERENALLTLKRDAAEVERDEAREAVRANARLFERFEAASKRRDAVAARAVRSAEETLEQIRQAIQPGASARDGDAVSLARWASERIGVLTERAEVAEAENARLKTWQKAYAKGRAGLVEQADQDFARAEAAEAERDDLLRGDAMAWKDRIEARVAEEKVAEIVAVIRNNPNMCGDELADAVLAEQAEFGSVAGDANEKDRP